MHPHQTPILPAGKGIVNGAPRTAAILWNLMRLSQLFAPTLREDPAEAEIASHRLLLRGGFIRQVMAGVYTMFPLGPADDAQDRSHRP